MLAGMSKYWIWIFAVCGVTYADVIGIISGAGAPNYVALVDSSGAISPVFVPGVLINRVAINSSGLSVAGGVVPGNKNWAGFISSSGVITGFSTNASIGAYGGSAVSINSSGASVAAGSTSDPIGVLANSMGIGQFLTIPTCSGGGGLVGNLSAAALNDSGFIIVGGRPGQNTDDGVYIGRAVPNSINVDQVACTAPSMASGNIHSVAINNKNLAIAGGFYNPGGGAYVVIFDAAEEPLPTLTSVTFPFPDGDISSVSINDSGTSIIGGTDNVNAAFAALVNSTGGLVPLSGDPLPIMGVINSVSIQDVCGSAVNAIIGGQDTMAGSAYAALVDTKGVLHNLSGLPSGPSAAINSVSINAFGTGLLGGTPDGINGYAALVTPSGQVIPLNVSGAPPIVSVSIRALSALPVDGLTGNNLIFANYINQYAPEKAFYFCPSIFDGTFTEALESAAPTRNAVSVFAADHNLFFLNHSLSAHLRNHRHFRKRAFLPNADAGYSAAFSTVYLEEQFLVQNDASEQDEMVPSSHFDMPMDKERPYTLWFEALGAFASQQAQDQTIGFNPSMGGFILAFEALSHETVQIGGGAAYTFTHIHEHKDAGSARINQEYLFAYATWSDEQFYIDAAVWGGIFQTHQTRHIRMTGFEFESTSDPKGFQLSPHIECGYDKAKYMHSSMESELVIDPFVMADWVNAWQDSYQETGDSPFNIEQRAQYSSFLRTEAGFRFYEMISFNTWRLILEEKGSYVYKKPFKVGTVNAFLVGSPGSFTVETFTSAQNLGVAEMSFIFQPKNQRYPYGSISYQGEFGEGYQSHQVLFETSWDF